MKNNLCPGFNLGKPLPFNPCSGDCCLSTEPGADGSETADDMSLVSSVKASVPMLTMT